MLVTELMESGDLWHALLQYKESGVLSWYRRGRRIAVEIARGLHFLHRHNIVHFVSSPALLANHVVKFSCSIIAWLLCTVCTAKTRHLNLILVCQDLKSPNVLLTRDGTAKISDVGFANILSNTHLSTGEAAFTFAWAAPEVRKQYFRLTSFPLSCHTSMSYFSGKQGIL